MPPYLHFNIHHFIKRLDPVQSRCSKLSPESHRISDALLVKFIPVCSNMVELWWSVFFREERRRLAAKNGRNPCRDQPSRNEQTRHDLFAPEATGILLHVCQHEIPTRSLLFPTVRSLHLRAHSVYRISISTNQACFFPFFKDIIEM